ncbi:hypothetical protein LuPra_03349 [Luteitalea pratensis]|uniref:Ice-binding protein C-terminal domain-containing protein n=1 Tax=Luteitalea pratensis TaxID=1855912 RepID=A0A143PNU7_LUTPR|nr:PEP-CTERM sorting domain-containing protein [Luteitalea pratensis]AMY10121.1 hypothetical protein LuPra_03349 [Luteitalea pratensis]
MFRFIIATALALVCTASPSAAAIVDWTFLGTVTSLSVNPNIGGGDFRSHFAVGDPWRVDLALNTDTINGCSYPQAGGAGGVYSFAPLGTSTIGDDAFTLRSGALEMNTQGGNCGIGMVGAGVQFRFFTVTSTTMFGTFQPPIEGALWWFGTPGYAIPTSAAGVLGGALAMRVGLTNINGVFTEASASVREVDVVPEPTTLLLFVAGAVALRRRRR